MQRQKASANAKQLKPRVPSYRLHKPSGQARVIIKGKHHYLGPHGSKEICAKYSQLIAERFEAPPASDNAAAAIGGDPSGLYVVEPVDRYSE
jgi:hypothetical protein